MIQGPVPSIPNVFFPTICPMNPQKQPPRNCRNTWAKRQAPCYCYPPGSMLCVDPQAEVSVKFVPHRGVAFHRKNEKNLSGMMSCDVKGIQPEGVFPIFFEVKVMCLEYDLSGRQGFNKQELFFLQQMRGFKALSVLG